MNGIFVFGLIFLVIALCVYPKLMKVAPDGACPQADKDVENNKTYFKIFFCVAIAMTLIGGLMMIF